MKHITAQTMQWRMRLALITIAFLLVASLVPSMANFNGGSGFALTSPKANSTVGLDLSMSWTPVSGAAYYKLQLSSTDDPNFEGPDYSLNVKATSKTISDVYPMTYIARVIARRSDGSRIAKTPTITFVASKNGTTPLPTQPTIAPTQPTIAPTQPTVSPTKPTVPPTQATNPPVNPGSVWKPKPGTSWYWQINGKVNEGVNAAMYDVDLFEAVPTARSYTIPGFGTVNIPGGQPNAGIVDKLHAQGRIVICYVDTGAAEYQSNRYDYELFPKASQGSVAEASDGSQWSERWLNTSSPTEWNKWAPIMWARFDLAKSIGCDGVEPDQNNHVGNQTGFPESPAIDTAWYLEVAKQAHARGLSVGMKNGIEAINSQTVAAFDWALNEECNQYDECDVLKPFIAAGKAVFNAEYPKVSGGAQQSAVCPNAKSLGLSSMGYPLELGGGYFFDCLTGLSVPTGTNK